MKYYYKIVAVNQLDSYRLESCSVEDAKYIINYTPNTWLKQANKALGIFIFEALDDAVDFVNGKDGVSPARKRFLKQIWKCEVKFPRVVKTINFFTRYVDDYMLYIKRKRACIISNIMSVTPPSGTLVCNAVKLVELYLLNLNEKENQN